jgi:hypothetical protein
MTAYFQAKMVPGKERTKAFTERPFFLLCKNALDPWRRYGRCVTDEGISDNRPMIDAKQHDSAQGVRVSGTVQIPARFRDRMTTRFLTHF